MDFKAIALQLAGKDTERVAAALQLAYRDGLRDGVLSVANPLYKGCGYQASDKPA